jgi:predicted metal-binding membrane protein
MVEPVRIDGHDRTFANPHGSRAGSDGPTARAWIAAALVSACCWVLTIRDVQRMAGGMRMPGGWTMSMAWMSMPGQSIAGAALMFIGMWEVMMIAMMLPSVMPTVLLHRRLRASRRTRGESAPPQVVLLAGYFTVWLVFGIAAFVAGFGLSAVAMQYERVSRAIPAAAGVALMIAGLYQVTPLKRICLRHCRSPLSFVVACWRPGWLGTFRLGLHHGAYCAACCWALMLIQLVLGVMSLPLMVAVAAVIALEKMWRHGERLAEAVGAVAFAVGIVMTITALGT